MSSKRPHLNIITRRMRHHAQASGYDRLADYLDADVIYPITEWKLHQRAIARAGSFLINRSGSQWYQRDGFMSELEAGWKWMRHGRQVFHFLYGENSYRYLGNLKLTSIQNAIICTYHTPKEKFNQLIINKKPIQQLDAIIVVSSSQQEIFSDFISPEKIHFIPHGVDTEFYRPPSNDYQNDVCKCLCVGTHLRDYDVLATAAKALSTKNVKFIVVTSAIHREKFKGLDNVRLLTGVEDDQLLSIYQSCDIFIMPVIDSTANNALLEAMSCGLPIVATNIQGIRDYVNESMALLTDKGDADSLVNAIEYLFNDEDKREQMACASREQALTFAWDKIAIQVKQLYRKIST